MLEAKQWKEFHKAVFGSMLTFNKREDCCDFADESILFPETLEIN